jgi:hypothetical protein
MGLVVTPMALMVARVVLEPSTQFQALLFVMQRAVVALSTLEQGLRAPRVIVEVQQTQTVAVVASGVLLPRLRSLQTQVVVVVVEH